MLPRGIRTSYERDLSLQRLPIGIHHGMYRDDRNRRWDSDHTGVLPEVGVKAILSVWVPG